jgi:hypothetical protein
MGLGRRPGPSHHAFVMAIMLTTPTSSTQVVTVNIGFRGFPGETAMRRIAIPLALLLALGGCKAEKTALDVRSTRTVVVEPKHIDADRQAVGEVKPR